ncbi:MAG TPA: PLDc N-terminal domain-containing protein [Candidatus Agrococcus pullicola]|uniref:PLDc N-terminal domain-containing protein n=1 Tax=Candidatus Agrococcus pullicola TaxID=2838429 RepID=A0A9D2C8W0_9MICO|nr:PLDc N-terminal domain-containing protein [Candidatus Agrococcus pullicola]
MTPMNDISIPFEWTVSYTIATVAVIAIIVTGVAWTLLDRSPIRPLERVVWVIVQIALPVVGFVLWLVAASPLARRTGSPRRRTH